MNWSAAAESSNFYLLQRHLSDILRCVGICYVSCNGFLMTQRQMTSKEVCLVYNVKKLHRPLGHVCRTVSQLILSIRFDNTGSLVVQHLRFCGVLFIARSVSRPGLDMRN